MTPMGIELVTFWLVAQCLNRATAYPTKRTVHSSNYVLKCDRLLHTILDLFCTNGKLQVSYIIKDE